MLNWLFGKDSGHATLSENQERARKQVVEEIRRKIGEPVMTMAKSILETDEWEMELIHDRMDYYWDRTTYLLHHVKKDVSITVVLMPEKREFIGHYGEGSYKVVPAYWEVSCDWMTEEELVFMADVIVQYRALLKQKADDAHAKEMAEKRARVAALLNIEVPN